MVPDGEVKPFRCGGASNCRDRPMSNMLPNGVVGHLPVLILVKELHVWSNFVCSRPCQGPVINQRVYNLHLHACGQLSTFLPLIFESSSLETFHLISSSVRRFRSFFFFFGGNSHSFIMRIFTPGQLLWSSSLLTVVSGFPDAGNIHSGTSAHGSLHKRCPYGHDQPQVKAEHNKRLLFDSMNSPVDSTSKKVYT